MQLDYSSLAREYARHRRVLPEVVQALVEVGGLGADSRVLDVGCGTGNYSIALENLTGCSCWGVDPSDQMLAKARERASHAQFKPGRAEHLDFPPESFDLVFSVDVIHHVGERPAFFGEAFRVLKAGGRICTVTDSEEIIRTRRPLSNYFPETVAIELQRYPPIAELRRMMLACGFDDLQETLVEHAYELAELDAYRSQAFSCLHLIPAEAFERGLRRMEHDLREAPIPAVSRYLLLWGRKQSR